MDWKKGLVNAARFILGTKGTKWFATTWMSDAGRQYMICVTEHRSKLIAFLRARLRAINLNIMFLGEDTGIYWAIKPNEPHRVKHYLFG